MEGNAPLNTSWYLNGTLLSGEGRATCVFNESGTYEARFLLQDNNSEVYHNQLQISVYDIFPLQADFSLAGSNYEVGEAVEFQDRSIGEGNLNYQWNFGDGSENSSLRNPNHEYSAPGTYEVTLLITNATGAYALNQKNITIREPVSSGEETSIIEYATSLVSGFTRFVLDHLLLVFLLAAGLLTLLVLIILSKNKEITAKLSYRAQKLINKILFPKET